MSIELLSVDERQLLIEATARHGKAHDGVWYRTPPPWRKRSEVVARWIGSRPDKFGEFTDIGCGSMYLRSLVPHLKYVPCDFAARSEDTIVVDLNKAALPVTGTNAATVLGVIEYLYEPEKFVRSLRQYKHVIISYNHKSFKESRKKRISHFWVNHLSRRAFRDLLLAHGFKVLRWRYLKIAEILYEIERVE